MHPYLVHFLSCRSVTEPPCVASCLFHFLHIPWGLRRSVYSPQLPRIEAVRFACTDCIAALNFDGDIYATKYR
jgi:hypothetical protein